MSSISFAPAALLIVSLAAIPVSGQDAAPFSSAAFDPNGADPATPAFTQDSEPAQGGSDDACFVENYAGFAWTESVAAMFVLPPPYATASAAGLPARTLSHSFTGSIRPRPAGSSVTSAPARVYLEDPDDPAPTDIDLPNLTGDGTRLEGLYARVRSDKLDADGKPAVGRDGLADFRFDPILGRGVECSSAAGDEVEQYCSRLDAVNVYYHIDKVAREYWIDRLGVDIGFQADVTTHIAGDGAFANAEQSVMKMGAGDIFMKNTALEDEIIYHEYAHLVTARLGFEIDTESSEEARGLSEGYADYFAASFTNDPRIGEWVVTCPPRQHCEGPPNDDEFTRLDLDPDVWNWNQGDVDPMLQYGFCLRYHEGDTKCKASYNYRPGIYVWGMIWSNTLWDIRSRLGAATLDPVLVEAIRMHQAGVGDVDFEEAVIHVILANRTLNGGADESIIRELFEARGYPTPIIDSIDEPGEAPSGDVSLDIYPNPASGTAWVQLEASTDAAVTLRIVDMLGRTVAEQTGGVLTPVDVSDLPQGVYFMRVTTPGGIATRRLTVAR